jgi:iron complex transport system substrate-binding protein
VNERWIGGAVALALVGVAAGCGADASEPIAGAAGTVATTGSAAVVDAAAFSVVDARGVEVAITSVERVIPLDGDVAEIVFALGLGDLVVATDLSATYPPEADALPQIGYQRALTAEPILEFDPTLLLATDIAGPTETLDDLERVGIPLVVVPTDPSPTGPATKIVAVAEALGVPERGAALAADVQGSIDAAIASRPPMPTRPKVVTLYVRGASTQLILGEEFAIHWLVEAAGGDDVADEIGVTGSAPITAEALLDAAPDVVLVPASGLESAGGVEGLLASMPALAGTPAGRSGNVLAYDDQLMLGNGPRTGAFLATLIADLHTAAERSP